MRIRGAVLAIILLIVAAVSAATAPPANASRTPPTLLLAAGAVAGRDLPALEAPLLPAPATGPTIALRSHTFSATSGGELEFQLEIATTGASGSDDQSAFAVVVATAPPVVSRSSVAAIAEGTEKPQYRVAATMPLSKLEHGSTTLRTLRLKALSGSGAGASSGDIFFPSDGVYPTSIELRRADETRGTALSAVPTFLAFTARPAERPLRTALEWPISTLEAGRNVDGVPTQELAGEIAPGGRLRRLTALAASSPIPLSLKPVPESLSDLMTAVDSAATSQDARTDAAIVLDSVRVASRRTGSETLPLAYANPPSSIFSDPAFASDLTAQIELGQTVTRDALGPAIQDETVPAPPGPIDGTVLQRLVDTGAARVVVPEAILKPTVPPQQPTQPFLLQGTGDTVSSVASDTDLSRLMSSPTVTGRPDSAYRVLAEIAAVYFDAPSSTRGVLISPDVAWDAPDAFTTLVLSGLAGSTFVAPVSVSRLFDEVPPALGRRRGPVIRDLSGEKPGPVPHADVFENAQSTVAGYRSILIEANPLPERLGERILSAEGASDLAGGGSGALATLGAVEGRVGEELSNFRVPASNGITLTSRDGVIPLRIENAAGYPVRVVLELESEKLRFPGDDFGQPFDLPPNGQTQDIHVVADATGVFPLKAMLFSPDHLFKVAESNFSVRSTGASGAALLITAGAAGFLALWWSREFLRSRRRRRSTPQPN